MCRFSNLKCDFVQNVIVDEGYLMKNQDEKIVLKNH